MSTLFSIPLQRIADKLQALRRADPEEEIFGAEAHHYRAAPALSVEALCQIEATWDIALPEDYAAFLTTLGNGGVGPAYGLQHLSHEALAHAEALSQPFPLQAPVRGDESSVAQEGDSDPTPGTLMLADYGCGMEARLVLNGAFKGQVWFFAPEGNTFVPFAEMAVLHHVNTDTEATETAQTFTFLSWFEHWLDHALVEALQNAETNTNTETN